ncbi:hypothetical protein, partial [Pseudomonas oryzihabitans]|uniref:hypothetical protein n=1 Tax=Pseudomonas oryzihabitans TaxID=47885 RepID=UPI0028953B48
AAASDSAYGFNFGLTARESGAAARTDISDAMRADPYHPDWKNYVGGEARAVGADVPRIDGGTPDLLDTTSSGPIWSSTKSKSAVENALGHWDKHKSEFPELQNAKQYAEEAKSFLINPPQGTLTKTNARGDTLRYDPGTNTFGVLGQDGAPRTMFRPTDGINYWNRQ